MSVENIIELKGIKKRFEDNFEAVKDFNLQVKKGEFVTFSWVLPDAERPQHCE